MQNHKKKSFRAKCPWSYSESFMLYHLLCITLRSETVCLSRSPSPYFNDSSPNKRWLREMPPCTPSEAYCSLSPAEVIMAHCWPHTKEGLIGDTLSRGNSGWMASFCCFKWVWGAAHSSSLTTTDGLEDHLCLNHFSPTTAETYQLSASLPRGSKEVRHLSRVPKAETNEHHTRWA